MLSGTEIFKFFVSDSSLDNLLVAVLYGKVKQLS